MGMPHLKPGTLPLAGKANLPRGNRSMPRPSPRNHGAKSLVFFDYCLVLCQRLTFRHLPLILASGVAMSSTVAGTSLAFPASTRSTLRLQISIALVLALGIASYFWVDSRYPSLLKKLHSGTSIKTSGALSFDAKLP